jgi:hypothetical protein
MKIYSLYYKDTFVVAFPNREDATDYGKIHYADLAWDCNIVEEYLSKSPLTYSSPLTSLTPQQTIPCNPGITVLPGTPKINPDPYPHIYCDGTK